MKNDPGSRPHGSQRAPRPHRPLCAAAREHLSARRDREGCGQARAARVLARHAARCPECRRFAAGLERLDPLFGALRAAQPPPELAGAVLVGARAGVRRATSRAPVTERTSGTRAAAGPRAARERWFGPRLLLRLAAAAAGFLAVLALAQGGARRATPGIPSGTRPADAAGTLHALQVLLGTQPTVTTGTTERLDALPERFLLRSLTGRTPGDTTTESER